MKKVFRKIILFAFVLLFTNSVFSQNCIVSISERDALIAFYNATDGANWTNTLANNEPWDINVPVCDWYGVAVSNGHVTGLEIGNNNFVGVLPPELGDLTFLKRLNLNSIPGISGVIPPEIGNLTSLSYLRLQNSQLSGSIPASIGQLTNLESLQIVSSNISGNIPVEIGNLVSIKSIYLYSNNLSGPIPSQIWSLPNLEVLELFYNDQLSGSIPVEVGNALNLKRILIMGAQLSGTLPEELGLLTNLEYLALYNNQFSGSIPESLGNLTNLKGLHLRTNLFSGSIPESIGNLNNLDYAYFNYNNFSGNVPSGFASMTNLNIFEISNNAFIFSDFEDEHNDYSNNLTTYTYTSQEKVDNAVAITIAEGGNITLTSTELTSNNNTYQWYKDGVAISGATSKDYVIDPVTGTDAGVYHFLATNSVITGLILQREPITLGVSQNSCSVPQAERDALIALYNATDGPNWTNNTNWNTTAEVCDWNGITVEGGHVTRVSLTNNLLSGSIPPEIGDLPNLQYLVLLLNQLTGDIPIELWGLTSLVQLDISGNQLSGIISPQIGNLINLQALGLVSNQFSGAIPDSIGDLLQLSYLGLGDNQFTGTIPTSFANLTSLKTLYLYYNQLTGTIPESFGNLPILEHLELQNNQLSGDVPSSISQIATLERLRFENNSLVFSNFETEHNTYITNLTGNNGYTYQPQAKVDSAVSINAIDGESITLTSNELTSVNNTYQWYKDAVEIPGATSKDYVINSASATDAGVYYFIVNNSIVTDLSLLREPITLTIQPEENCLVPISERDALIAFYISTIGQNWTNNTNWDTTTPVCDWFGVTVTNGHVTSLNLINNNLNGPIPEAIGDLENLQYLILYQNELSGNIPSQLWTLDQLIQLNFHTNDLEGTLSSQVGNLTNLTHLYLYSNNFTGEIPKELGLLSQLYRLSLSDNQFTGEIPKELGDLSSLHRLYLLINNLNGEIPPELGQLDNLQRLSLGNNNLSGAIPSELGNMDALEDLWLGNNNLTSLPTTLENLSILRSLRVNNNNISGAVPSGIASISTMNELWVNNNTFVFSDFETEHLNYNSNLSSYFYNPQAKVDTATTIDVTEGGSITLTSTELTSLNNSYQWYKDGVAILDATSKDYVINPVTLSDAGVYHFLATNSIITGLTLEREPITLGVRNEGTIPCDETPEFQVVQQLMGDLFDHLVDDYEANGSITNDNPAELQALAPYIEHSEPRIYDFRVLTHIEGRHEYFFSFAENEDYDVLIQDNASINPQDSIESLTIDDNQDVPGYTRLTISWNAVGDIQTKCVIRHITLCEDIVPESDNHFCISDDLIHNLTYNSDENILFGGATSSLFTALSNNTTLQLSSEVYSIISIEINGVLDEDLDYEIIDDVWHFYNILNGSGNPYSLRIITDSVITAGVLTPSGPNIVWYLTSDAQNPIADDYDIYEDYVSGGISLWWDDTSTNEALTETTVIIYDAPEGDTEQTFSIYASPAPTISDIVLENGGESIFWYETSTSNTLLSADTVLVDGQTYYASSCGLGDDECTCRLPVTITLGILTPTGDLVQYLCDGASLNDIVLEVEDGLTVVWYDSETEGNALDGTTSIVSGNTYYAAQRDTAGLESEDRFPVVVFIILVDPPVVAENPQIFYADESRTVGDLIAFGFNIKWYNQATGGFPIDDETTPLIDGGIYYAEQENRSGCSGVIRTEVTVLFDDGLAEEPLVGCELFRPELSGHYVIDAWVNEREVTSETIEGIPFNNSDESSLFVGLLNHLKNRLMSKADNKRFFRDFPDEYTPEFTGGEPELDFLPLISYIEGLGANDNQLIVYDFEPIYDNYADEDLGRTIGFTFYLNSARQGQFEYRTPTFTYTVPIVSESGSVSYVDKTEHYPLLDNINVANDEFLSFTNVEVATSGQFIMYSNFNQTTSPLYNQSAPIYSESNIAGSLSDSNVIKSTSTTFKYTEVAYQATPSYNQAKIEISFVDANNEAIGIPLIFSPQGDIMDKWQKITGDFVIPNNAGRMYISLKNNDDSKVVYFDDLRIQPFDSEMKTFVYHPENQRLMSELDGNNYATFYEYDSEGGLIRVKKETVKGIYTIQETRSGNIKKTN